MQIQRRYLDEVDWENISREEALEKLAYTFANPKSVLNEAETCEKLQVGSGTIPTPNAIYRVVL